MITKYFDFFNSLKVNEAFSLEQASLKAEEFINKILSNRALSEKKIEVKKQIIKKLGLTNEEYLALSTKKDLTEEETSKLNQIKEAINKTALSEQDKSDIKNSVEANPFLKRIRAILSTVGHPEWIFGFIKLFYYDFDRFKIDLEKDRQKIVAMLGSYTSENGRITTWNKDTETNQENYAGFGELAKQLSNASKSTQSKVVNDLESNVFNEKQKEEIIKTSDRQTGFDIVETAVKNIELDKNTLGFLSKLPTGVKDKEGNYIAPNLLKEFNELPEDSELKKEIIEKTKKLVALLMKDYSFEPYKKPLENRGKPVKDKDGKQVYVTYYPCEATFSPRMGTSADPQKFKSLEEYLESVNINIESLSDVSKSRLFKEVSNVNTKFGEDKGVEVVYNNNNSDNIVVLKVKSYDANHYLHDRASGRLMQTQHCIAYGKGHYDSIVDDSPYNKLYYVYNFNLEPTDDFFPFGIIVHPDIDNRGNILTDDSGNTQIVIVSSYNKPDNNIKLIVKNKIKEYGLDFNKIFLTATKEEIKYIQLKQNASIVLLKENLTLEEAKEAIENFNADVNAKGGIPLINALKVVNTELVKYLLSKGANPNLGNAILKAAVLEHINLLVENNPPAIINLENNLLLTEWLEEEPTQNVKQIIKYLLDKGCSPIIGKKPPITLAKDFDIIKLLCEAGANPYIINLINSIEDESKVKYLIDNGLANNITANLDMQYQVWKNLININISLDKFKNIFNLCLQAKIDITCRGAKIISYAVGNIEEVKNTLKLEFVLEKIKESKNYNKVINSEHIWEDIKSNYEDEEYFEKVMEIINKWANKDLFAFD